MRDAPFVHRLDDRLQSFSRGRKSVFHLRWDFRIDLSADDAVLLELSKMLREYLFGNTIQVAMQLAEAARSGGELTQNHQLPASADDFECRFRRATDRLSASRYANFLVSSLLQSAYFTNQQTALHYHRRPRQNKSLIPEFECFLTRGQAKESTMKALPRRALKIIEPQPVVEGAGVRLKRSIGTRTLDYLDPFLLLDHFASTNPRDYEAGFPLHPHRGIETVTYVLSGTVSHKDTLGNSGSIGAGDLQWMTAGGGIMHEEMPQVRPEGIAGFQLWVNLPAKLKMTAPRYQHARPERIPETKTEGGARVRVHTGALGETAAPVDGIAAAPVYLNVKVPARSTLPQPIPRRHAAFAYVFAGQARFAPDGGGHDGTVSHSRLVVLGDGDFLKV